MVTIGIAFLAGLVSFLSPCVFSLVPAYIGYLGGRAVVQERQQAEPNRWLTVAHGVAFVLGFSFVFILTGVAVSTLGALLNDLKPWIARIGGVVIILFGLHMTGLLRISLLEYDLRPQTKDDQQRGFLSSALMGIFFSFGWSPCIGPTLGAIYTIAGYSGDIAQGVSLLAAYSVGLAIPFIAAAIGVGWVTVLLRKYGKMLRYIEIGMGVFLIIVGILLFLGVFEQLANFGWYIDFGL